jgi:hypothetical protein
MLDCIFGPDQICRGSIGGAMGDVERNVGEETVEPGRTMVGGRRCQH